jgi:hypothetical protein
MEFRRLIAPPQDRTALQPLLLRVVLAALFAWIGFKAGVGYIHLCDAGSRLTEGSAAFGTPLLVGALVLYMRRLWLAVLGAALVTLVVYALCRPYLDWIHGS